jgi:hypothetical protein
MIVKASNSSFRGGAHRGMLSRALLCHFPLSSFGVSLKVSLPREEYNENEECYVEQEKRNCQVASCILPRIKTKISKVICINLSTAQEPFMTYRFHTDFRKNPSPLEEVPLAGHKSTLQLCMSRL